MTQEEREEMIGILTMRMWGYSEAYFENLTDEELQERYNRMTEMEMEQL